MKGTVQGYFGRAFDEMADKELETPLANSGLGGERSTPNVQRSTLK